MYHNYPYTDFHEMYLDGFLSRFKELLAEFGTISAAWQALRDEFDDNLKDTVDNILNKWYDDGIFSELIYSLATEQFVNVTMAGIDNTGESDVTVRLTELLNDSDLTGRTFYFPAGTYLLDSELVVPFSGNNIDVYCDNGARFTSSGNRQNLIVLDGTTARNNIMNVWYGGIIDGSRCDVALKTTDRFIRSALDNVNIICGNTCGLQIGESATLSTNADFRNLNIRNLDATYETDGIHIYSNDNRFSNISTFGTIVGIDCKDSSGHRMNKVSVYTGAIALQSQSRYNKTVGIIDNVGSFYEQLYFDTVCTGMELNNINLSIITNVIEFWDNTAADYIANKTACIFNCDYTCRAMISDAYLNDNNNRNSQVFIVSGSGDFGNFINENRLKLSNVNTQIHFSTNDVFQISYDKMMQYRTLYKVGPGVYNAESWYRIAFVTALAYPSNVTVNIATTRGYATFNILVRSNRLDITRPIEGNLPFINFDLGYSNMVTVNGINGYWIYAKCTDTTEAITISQIAADKCGIMPYVTDNAEESDPVKTMNIKPVTIDAGGGTIKITAYSDKVLLYLNNVTYTGSVTLDDISSYLTNGRTTYQNSYGIIVDTDGDSVVVGISGNSRLRIVAPADQSGTITGSVIIGAFQY